MLVYWRVFSGIITVILLDYHGIVRDDFTILGVV
jgi:hypothetical protein